MGKYDILENISLGNYIIPVVAPLVVPQPLNVILKAIPLTSDAIPSYTLEITWDRPFRVDGSLETFVTSYLIEIARNDGVFGNQQEILEGVRIARYENVGNGLFKARVSAKVTVNNKISAWSYSGDPIAFFPINAILDLDSNSFFFID